MLTGQLIRARVRGPSIEAMFIDSSQPKLLHFAQQVLEVIDEATQDGANRARLMEELDAVYGDDRQQKLLNGIVKIALDRCDFSTDAGFDPVALRREVFLLARERGPVASEPGPFQRPTAADIYRELSEKKGIPAEVIQKSLYSDLRESHALTGHRLPNANWLLERYNVALVQALLLRSVSLEIQLENPSQPRLKQLFRYIKFYQLMHQARQSGQVLHIKLDGPTSLLRQSTRYGMALANFLPALLLQPGPWNLKATLLWTKANHQKSFSLDSDSGLQSHYPDTGAYETRTQEWFRERFEALECDWVCKPANAPITLGDADVIMPDFCFTKGKRRAYLEIIGFWSPERLNAHLEAVRRHGNGNIIVAVSRKLNGSKEVLRTNTDLPMIEFAEVIPSKRVLEALEEYGC